jgi:hypothetical protein
MQKAISYSANAGRNNIRTNEDIPTKWTQIHWPPQERIDGIARPELPIDIGGGDII